MQTSAFSSISSTVFAVAVAALAGCASSSDSQEPEPEDTATSPVAIGTPPATNPAPAPAKSKRAGYALEADQLAPSPAGLPPIAAPGTPSVEVVNTATNPVPTQSVGTTTVTGAVSSSQAGAWTVGATQSGAWSVVATQFGPWAVDVGSMPPVSLASGASVAVSSMPPVSLAGTPSVSIAGTPAVSIAGTPSVSIAGTPSVAVSGAVTVANTDAAAVPVRVVEGGGRAPWIGGGQILLDPGEDWDTEQFFSVPHGKVLVIESFSIELLVPDGQVGISAAMLGSVAGVGKSFRFPLQPVPAVASAFDTFAVFGTTKINVTGGVLVTVIRNSSTGTGVANVAISGYLADL